MSFRGPHVFQNMEFRIPLVDTVAIRWQSHNRTEEKSSCAETAKSTGMERTIGYSKGSFGQTMPQSPQGLFVAQYMPQSPQGSFVVQSLPQSPQGSFVHRSPPSMGVPMGLGAPHPFMASHPSLPLGMGIHPGVPVQYAQSPQMAVMGSPSMRPVPMGSPTMSPGVIRLSPSSPGPMMPLSSTSNQSGQFETGPISWDAPPDTQPTRMPDYSTGYSKYSETISASRGFTMNQPSVEIYEDSYRLSPEVKRGMPTYQRKLPPATSHYPATTEHISETRFPEALGTLFLFPFYAVVSCGALQAIALFVWLTLVRPSPVRALPVACTISRFHSQPSFVGTLKSPYVGDKEPADNSWNMDSWFKWEAPTWDFASQDWSKSFQVEKLCFCDTKYVCTECSVKRSGARSGESHHVEAAARRIVITRLSQSAEKSRLRPIIKNGGVYRASQSENETAGKIGLERLDPKRKNIKGDISSRLGRKSSQ